MARLPRRRRRRPRDFYDEVDPFQGHYWNVFSGITIQPNSHLTQNIGLNVLRFDRESTKERVYGAPPQLGNNNYLMVNRGLFLKASYLRRF